MGTASSEITTTNDKGETVYNTSIYTSGADSIPMLVQDFPYVIWETGHTLSESYQLRLILEIVMWGCLAIALEIASNLGALALTADTDFPNAPGNSTGLFRVDITFFSVAAIIRIISGLFKCFMVGANIQFYATRTAEYDR